MTGEKAMFNAIRIAFIAYNFNIHYFDYKKSNIINKKSCRPNSLALCFVVITLAEYFG